MPNKKILEVFLMLPNSVTLDSKPLEIEEFNYTEFGIIGFCVRGVSGGAIRTREARLNGRRTREPITQ